MDSSIAFISDAKLNTEPVAWKQPAKVSLFVTDNRNYDPLSVDYGYDFRKFSDLSETNLILANIDAKFRVTNSLDTFLEPSDLNSFSFVEIGILGMFSSYLQYRRPYSRGVGISTTQNMPANINPSGYSLQTGNYVKDFKILSMPLGTLKVDLALVYADKLLAAQVAIGCNVTQGNMIIRVPEIANGLTMTILYLASLSFSEAYLFKPISSIDKTERFMIYKNKTGFDLNKWGNLENLIIKYPTEFEAWLLAQQKSITSIKLPNLIDYHKALTIWHVPFKA